MTVDGTPYTLKESPTGWWVCFDSVRVLGPYRSRGQALSAAVAVAEAGRAVA